jgi:hypothetical protein
MKSVRFALKIALVGGIILGPVSASATPAGDREAYQLTMKCYVTDGFASDDQRKAGNSAKADAYEAKARRSFDLAYQFGQKIGLTEKQVGHDIDYAQSSELARMVRDRQYYAAAAANCSAVGLL